MSKHVCLQIQDFSWMVNSTHGTFFQKLKKGVEIGEISSEQKMRDQIDQRIQRTSGMLRG